MKMVYIFTLEDEVIQMEYLQKIFDDVLEALKFQRKDSNLNITDEEHVKIFNTNNKQTEGEII